MKSTFSLSPLIQVQISSKNTLTNTPKNNALLALWASLSLVKSIHRINHHKCPLKLNWNNSEKKKETGKTQKEYFRENTNFLKHFYELKIFIKSYKREREYLNFSIYMWVSSKSTSLEKSHMLQLFFIIKYSDLNRTSICLIYFSSSQTTCCTMHQNYTYL